jgi:hypothetical protein
VIYPLAPAWRELNWFTLLLYCVIVYVADRQWFVNNPAGCGPARRWDFRPFHAVAENQESQMCEAFRTSLCALSSQCHSDWVTDLCFDTASLEHQKINTLSSKSEWLCVVYSYHYFQEKLFYIFYGKLFTIKINNKIGFIETCILLVTSLILTQCH